MSTINYQLETERSREFFTDPQSYAGFELDESQRTILGCIDPRDQASNRLLTIVQTPGGAVGPALDRAIAETAISQELVSLEDGLERERDMRHSFKLGAHHVCKFINGIKDVLDEMANPTPFTEAATEHFVNYYSFEEEITPSILFKVQDAAKMLREEGDYQEDKLLDSVDRLYDTKNVVTMAGENTARLYVINHHPSLGLNRQKKHREAGLKVQGYHDSLGATIGDLAISRLGHEQRRYGLAAHIRKAAAVRTVIGDKDTFYYEGHMTERGLQVVEVEKNN